MREFEPTDRVTVISRRGITHTFRGSHIDHIETDPKTGMFQVVTNKGVVRPFRDPKRIEVGTIGHPVLTKIPE